MKLKHGLIGLSVVLGLFLTACEPGGGSTTPVAAADLIGKWLYRSEVAKGTIKTHAVIAGQTFDTTTTIDTTHTYTGSEYYIEFKSDNTYTANSPEMNGAAKASAASALETGTWAVSGATLTTISTTKDTAVVNVAISGTTLTGTMAIDDTNSEGTYSQITHVDITITMAKSP